MFFDTGYKIAIPIQILMLNLKVNNLPLTRALMGSGELHVLMGGGPKGPPP